MHKRKAQQNNITAKHHVKSIATEKKQYHSFVKKAMLVLFITMLTLAIAAGGSLALIYKSQTISAEKLSNASNTLTLLSADGSPIESQNDFKTTTLDSLPEHTRWAFICTEDKHFYNHHGIAPGRIIKATIKNLKSGYAKEGASTITQQLIKNTHLTHEKTFQRKLREAALAHKLEQKYTKDQILEMYLNVLYFGSGVYGLESAATYYFGKTASNLTIRESAALAGIIRNPARYCPLTNFDKFNSRADLILRLMLNQGKISESQFTEATNETLKITAAKRTPSIAREYKAMATDEAAQILNLSAADLSAFGYKIHTYYDPKIQRAIYETANAEDYQIKNASRAAADKCIIVANPDGEISGYFATNPTLRGAKRNFASTLKPLTVYAPALELGVISPSTLITDEDYVSGDFHPKNHDGKYHGEVTIREAVTQSYNVPAAKVLDYTRLNRSVDISKNLGLNLTNDENTSLALGNTKNGTRFTELLAGYCTLANGGIKTNPTLIKKIVDRSGKTVYENLKTNTRVLGEDTCFLMTDMLKSSAKKGTAKALGALQFDIAAKTGTCERTGGTNTDAVNCSYTTDYVLLAWTGNTDMKSENDLPFGTTGGGITSYIARDIQKKINKNPQQFKKPESVDKSDDFFSLRFPPAPKAEVTPHPIKVDGKIGDTGAPMIWFNTHPNQTYKIYKNGVLQEVIKNNSGEYIFYDKNSTKGKTYEYSVKTSLTQTDNIDQSQELESNKIKLYTASEVNSKSKAITAKKKDTGKHWFF